MLRVAALDVDGTLAPGQIGAPLPRMLLEAGLCGERWQRLPDYLATLPADALEDAAVVKRVYELYSAMLEGVDCLAVNAVVQELWNRQRDQLFAFVRPLIADLRGAGFTVMLISSGLHELLTPIAREVRVDLFCGTRLETAYGFYTGQVCPSVGVPKHELAGALAQGRPIEWPGSLAIGNSLPDADLLERAGHPFAFEPSPALSARARRGAWPLADRHTLLTLVRSRLGRDPAASFEAAPIRAFPMAHQNDLAALLRAAQWRLTEHVIGQVSANGSVRGHCESRVVESALMLTLLRRENLLRGVQDALHTYLARSAPGAPVFDATLIDAVLRGIRVSDPAPIIERTLEATDHAGLDRKRLALSAVLAVVDAAPFTRVSAEAFDPHGEVPWTRALLLAVKILYLSEYGSPEGPELEELLVMLEAGQTRGVWEKHLFTHLFALLALNRARPGHPAIRQGVAHLAACQNLDGGMPFIVSEEIYATATAGLALARAGAAPRILASMGDYMAEQQQPDGGWAYAQGVLQTDVDSTSNTMVFLQAAGPDRYREPLSRGLAYLRSMAGPDGGFPTYVSGRPSEPAMTAIAMRALAPHRFSDQPLLDGAARFLLHAQRPDGTFGRSWSLSEAAAIFLSVLGLRAESDHDPASCRGRIPASIDVAHHRLLYTAHTDGGWGQIPACRSDPVSTAYSLIALARTHLETPTVRRGIRYLLSRQCPDGGYVGPSDQTGPRPLPYTVPVLGDNFILLAMTYLSAGPNPNAPPGPHLQPSLTHDPH